MCHVRFASLMWVGTALSVIAMSLAGAGQASARPPERLALACDACAHGEGGLHDGEDGDLADAQANACEVYDLFVEGGAPPIALYFENRVTPGQPAYELSCSGSVERACLNALPLVCGANGLANVQTPDEGRPVLVAVASAPMVLTIGDQRAELVAACPAAASKAKAAVCRQFEARLALDVSGAVDRFMAGSYSTSGTWTQSFTLSERDGTFIASGQIELSEFQDLVGLLGLWERAPADADLDGGMVLLLHGSTPVASWPGSVSAPLIAARHVMRLQTPAIPASPCVASKDPAAPHGVLSQAIEGVSLERFDRETGRALDRVPLPSLPKGSPCPSAYPEVDVRWLPEVYRDVLVAQVAQRLGLSTAAPATTSAGLRMPLGLAAPTVEALLKRVKGVRAHLGMALRPGGIPGLFITSELSDLPRISLQSGIEPRRLAAMGLDPTFAELIDGPASALEGLLGAPAKREAWLSGERWRWDPVAAKLGMALQATISDAGRVVSLDFVVGGHGTLDSGE
jgi:hypothetical protein